MCAGTIPLERLLDIWRNERTIAPNIVYWKVDAARPSQLTGFPENLHPLLVEALEQRNIRQLYTHQLESWQVVRDGKNVVIVTGTASGKTLCYNLPVLDECIRNGDATALYLFPTKALTQDQFESLNSLIANLKNCAHERGAAAPDIPVGIYDGDTPLNQRAIIRSKVRLLMSNPDMLHMGILPHHTLWARFLRNLRYIIIDEVHLYRGVFGSHIANLIRRLKRVVNFYGVYPQFMLTSATIANPVELCERLIEAPVEMVVRDGSPRGPRHFLLYNPPVIHQQLRIRRSAQVESARLADDLLAYGVQTLLFARARRSVELLLRSLQQQQSGQDNEVHGYRSGYLAEERRYVERSLRLGQTRAVVATNALELGVDIGSAGAVILVGYPGSIAATRQQAGRAGRRLETSLAVLVASGGPLDQYLMRHPEYIFDQSPEQALINPDNLLILLQHLRCAAFELPFRKGDHFGGVPEQLFEHLLNFLAEEGVLHPSGERYFWMADQYPANQVSLRSASGSTVILQVEDNGAFATVGEIDEESATWMVHPQAVYIHEGKTFLVQELSLDERKAQLQAVDVDFYTEPRKDVTIINLGTLAQAEVSGGLKSYGEIQVTTQVIGYRRIRWHTHEILMENPLDMLPTQLRTIGYWFTFSEEFIDRLRLLGVWKSDQIHYGPNWVSQRDMARQRDGFRCQMCGALEINQSHHVHHKVPFRNFLSFVQANQLDNLITLCAPCHKKAELVVRMRSGMAGMSYVMHNIAPLFLMCDIGDLGVHFDYELALADGKPTIVLYDLLPAGIGLSEAIYQIHDELILRCCDLVESCDCLDGCPGCVGPAGEHGIGGKLETLALLSILAGKNPPAG
ncbi:MAG: DEAD/DEAH box helicase [Anaerolineaceae bacterium]|jgi:DEAD/DEAH box helicase domain-containing protein